MLTGSVNTNVGAMIALQNLNATSAELATVQNRINTGKKVATAKDNGAIWAIAQGQRADVKALNAVKESLDRGISAVDVALAAGESISDLLVQMKELALAATDEQLKTASREALNEDFTALRDQITTVIDNAEFNGVNLLGTSEGYSALANVDGDSTITVEAEILSLGGSIVTVGLSENLLALSDATAALSAVTASIAAVSGSLARLGTDSKALEMHRTFIGKLSDSLEAGIGNLVDADLAKESARRTALQTKQQLGTQALSIANQTPQILLNLFGN